MASGSGTITARSSKKLESGPQAADVLVVFGITGDLAKVMIFRYPPGSWGPEAAEKLVATHGGWHGPWLTQ